MSGWPEFVVTDEAAMGVALDEARRSARHDDVPVGAVVVLGGAVVAARHNERELSADPTAHAEMLVIRDAAALLDRDQMAEASLVVSLEPCVMCAGAIRAAGIGTVVFGAFDIRAGAGGSRYDILDDVRLGPSPVVVVGVRADESAELLRAFFAERRPQRG